MEPARKLDYRQAWDKPWDRPSPVASKNNLSDHPLEEQGTEIQPWEIKLGKMVFYLTIAAGLWFFYWFNGIQCPC